MVADFAVHSPDKEDGGISNPHFHVMCPIRPLDEHGRWGNKQRREYVLDEHGERILDEAGNYVFNAAPTTDWGSPETLEHWRQAWADLCNQKFAEKGLDCRIDHRSYERQGIEQIPTYYNNRNKGAYSTKAKTANLQRYADAFRFLQAKQLFTTDDLDTALHSMQNSINAMKASAGEKQSRIKELDELLRMAQYYVDGKPVADKLRSIRFEKSRQKYKSEHDDSLRRFYMAERKLKPHFKDGKLPITAWRRERERLEQEYKDIQTELLPLYADVKKLWAIHYSIYEVQHEQERQNATIRQKKQEIEL